MSNAKITQRQTEIIKNIFQYITVNKEALKSHYLSVKTANGQNKKNDIYQEIDTNSFYSELLKVSVVILTANYFECEILNLNVYKKNMKKIKKIKDGLQLIDDWHIVKAYIMEINDYVILHLHAPETGSNTPCGSSDLVRYVGQCEFLNPMCVISFGICYGVDYKNYSLGDTLIAEKIYPWSIGIKINNDGWNIKGDDYIIDLRDNAAVLYSRIEEIIQSSQDFCPNQKAKLGNMLTAEAVLSNEKIKIQAISKAYGCNIIGGEMEGYGLAKESIYYNHTSCMVLKAICDWGAIKDIDKFIDRKQLKLEYNYKDQIQAYTVYCAYRVLNELFDKKIFEDRNIITSIYTALQEKYYSDGSIRKRVFDNFIEQYIINNCEKYHKISIERRGNLVYRITDNIKNQYFIKSSNNECYIFKQFLY